MPPEPGSLPAEAPKKTPWGKILAVVIVLIVIIAAVAVWALPRNGAPSITQTAVSTEVALVGDSITFTAQATDPDNDALTYSWDFGDGSTGTGTPATHAYTIPGRFIGLLTVSDGKGGVATNDVKLLFLTVNLQPAAVAEPAVCPSDATANTDFADDSLWTYTAWEGTSAEAYGYWDANGGDLGGHVNITTNFTVSSAVSGYYYQAFDYDGATPLIARLHLGWNVSTFGAGVGNTTAYAFVDTTAGAPTLGSEVWTSGVRTATSPWTNVTGIDVGSKLTAAGRYYLKIAARTQNDLIGSATTVGFDNVGLTWSQASGCEAGAVIAILSADKTTTTTGTAVQFNSNASWAFAFAWNSVADHSQGGAYALTQAADDSTLFSSIRYEWGDGTANTTGTSTAVGRTTHTFTSVGNFLVRLTVTFTHPDVTPSTTTASAGYTVRVVAAAPPQQVKNPEIFTTVTFGEPDYLDPAVDYETAGGEVLQSVYETLVWYQEGSESVTTLVPRLATAVPTPTDGGLNYTFNLRSGVKFHSGVNMTAADVEFSIERVLAIHDPDGPSWMLEQILTNYVSYYADSDCGPLLCTVQDWVDSEFASPADVPARFRAVLPAEALWSATVLSTSMGWAVTNTSVDQVNSTAVVVHLTHPYPAFLQIAAYTVMSVVSKAAVDAHGGVQWGAHNAWMDRNTVGTGPFKLKAWVPNQIISLERWDQYWRTRAAIKQVNIVKINDVATRELMLLAGDADFATIPRDHQYDVMNVDGTPKYATLRIVKDKPTFDVLFFGYNQNINAAGTPDPLLVPTNFFADVHIRKAFSYAFDYSQFIQNVIYGGGEQLRGPIPRGMMGYNGSLPMFSKNAALAQAELRLALDPRTPSPTDTYWDNGFSITLYYNAGNTVREQGCLLLKQGLEALGAPGTISVSVRALDWPVYLATLRARALPIFFLGWAPDYADPDDYAFPFLHSRGTFPQRVGYSNATIDALVAAAASELDPVVREKMYKDMQTVVVQDHVPYLWIYQATNFHVERSWVAGYYFNPMLSGGYYYSYSKA
ncbi:MAG: hypothetical protein A3K65_07255 [Euryarchaeota archaeon RBG_16_68_12]|nr:MAG: hypothetical protein A3K65_07255 [Euryarchaeota archaeon RBG_16_68_12]